MEYRSPQYNHLNNNNTAISNESFFVHNNQPINQSVLQNNQINNTIPTTKTTAANKKKSQTIFRIALAVILGFIILTLLSKFSENRKKYPAQLMKIVKDLIKKASRFNVKAYQDSDPLIRLEHINYAMAYANMVKSLMPSKDIERFTNVNINEMINILENEQQSVIQIMIRRCPTLQPKGMYAYSTGWINVS